MKKPEIINLTPHEINIVSEDGTVKMSFPSEGIARASQKMVVVGSLNSVELVSIEFGKTEDLPKPQEGRYFIVSMVTANAAKAEGRTTSDLLVTADPVRDEAGRIIGCRRFALV